MTDRDGRQARSARRGDCARDRRGGGRRAWVRRVRAEDAGQRLRLGSERPLGSTLGLGSGRTSRRHAVGRGRRRRRVPSRPRSRSTTRRARPSACGRGWPSWRFCSLPPSPGPISAGVGLLYVGAGQDPGGRPHQGGRGARQGQGHRDPGPATATSSRPARCWSSSIRPMPSAARTIVAAEADRSRAEDPAPQDGDRAARADTVDPNAKIAWGERRAGRPCATREDGVAACRPRQAGVADRDAPQPEARQGGRARQVRRKHRGPEGPRRGHARERRR